MTLTEVLQTYPKVIKRESDSFALRVVLDGKLVRAKMEGSFFDDLDFLSSIENLVANDWVKVE